VSMSEQAQRNYAEQFGDRVDPLALSDPEFFERHVNWAFGDVVTDSTLDARTRTMVQLAAVIAVQGDNEFRRLLDAALRVGITPIELKEVVYLVACRR